MRHPRPCSDRLKASKRSMRKWIYPMNRAAQTTRLLGPRFGHSLVAALLHVLPPNLSSWKLALYVIVFLLPGGSFVVLGAARFENQRPPTKPRCSAGRSTATPETRDAVHDGSRAYATSATFATPEHCVTTRNRIRTAGNTHLPSNP